MSSNIQKSELERNFQDLCQFCNIDRDAEESAWLKFDEVSQKFVLEGNTIEWFVCALYGSSRESFTPTVATETVVRGNCVSLVNLLRYGNMSISDFILKIKRWSEMAKLSNEFRHLVERLERSFIITYHLSQQYSKLFPIVFIQPSRDEKKPGKFRSAPRCSCGKLYEMCWLLFLCAKNENPNYTVDTMTSLHLLLCCIDLMYRNAVNDKREDLINPEFENSLRSRSLDSNSAITLLCEHAGAVYKEVVEIKNNSWKQILKRFYQAKTLVGNHETYIDLISNNTFDINLKYLNMAYEQYTLSVGQFDERILLNNQSHSKIKKEDLVEIMESDSSHQDTPYTRKHFLPKKEADLGPIANTAFNVRKLQEVAHITEPPQLIRNDEAVVKKVVQIINSMAEQFSNKYPNKEDSKKRFKLIKSLYYYLVEKIFTVEINNKPHIKPQTLLGVDTLHKSLIACATEIVIKAYNTDLVFPWTLDCFDIAAFHFYRIIEIVVVRQEGILTRSLIKHLNSVEEMCLQSLSWKKSSPLWGIIRNKPTLPMWCEVDASNISRRIEPYCQSPMNSAYLDTFVPADSARRDIFNVSKEANQHERRSDAQNVHTDLHKGSGSLKFFLRKFYKLSWLRISELCKELEMSPETDFSKIWTLFEISITQKTELMQDRHLDQIFMCAIYLYSKVSGKNKNFTDIMKFYRKQPQATSAVYREVLMDEGTNGDLIRFYNEIYVAKMKDYGLDIGDAKRQNHEIKLSPHPPETRTSPKLIMLNGITVAPMSTSDKTDCNNSPNVYRFGFSPRKDLRNLSAATSRPTGKRNLPFNDDAANINSKITKKLCNVIKDRQKQ